MTEQNGKKQTNSKPKSTEKLHIKQQSTLRTAHHYARLLYTIQHTTVLTIYPLILWTIIITHMLLST